jgi:hypothetical protein
MYIWSTSLGTLVVPAFGRKISDFSHCLILADGLCIGKGLRGLDITMLPFEAFFYRKILLV